MKFLQITVMAAIGLFLASGAQADIYRWVDQEGVVHFSNYSPAPDAEVFLKEKNEAGGHRSADDTVTVDEVVAAARQEMERVLQEDRLREMNRKLDELLRRSQDAESRLAAAEASAAEARDLAGEALAENRNYGPDVVYVTQPSYYMPDYPLFLGDSCLGYPFVRYPGSFRNTHFVSSFIHPDRFSRFGGPTFGGHLTFKGRSDGVIRHGRFPSSFSKSHYHTAFRSGSHGFYRGRGR